MKRMKLVSNSQHSSTYSFNKKYYNEINMNHSDKYLE